MIVALKRRFSKCIICKGVFSNQYTILVDKLIIRVDVH